MRHMLLCILLLLSTPLLAEPHAEAPQSMKLFSRETVTPLNFTLSDDDWRWLGQKREVNIATYAPENPPFAIIPESGTFEGISADYALLVLRYLGLRFHVLHYPNRNAALDGMRSGKVDILLDDDGGLLTQQPGLIKSMPYMPDHPALVSRETAMSKPMPVLAEARIALVRGYLSDDWVANHYPNAKITRYPSPQSALSSVAFSENDYFIGSLTTASFLIERNYATTLSIADIFPQEDTGPRFVFREADIPLQRSVDAVLQSISPVQHKVIFRHWSQGPNLWLYQSRLPLTEREQRWLSQHSELRVVINPLYAPFTLFDTQKQFHGISADILRLIHLRTGLNFKAVESDTIGDMFDLVKQQRADFIAAMSYSTPRDKQLLFTRPYVLPPFVLVVRDSLTAPHALTDHLTIAITPDNALRPWLKAQYPSLTLIDAENASVAMQMVNEGKADGAVNNLIGARYLIDRYFRGKLKIAFRLGEHPARIGFAVGRDQPELYSILNKALADIPPRDISMIANKWQGTPDVKLDTWAVYQSEFYWLAGVFAVLVITSLIWNYYLHREIRLRKEAQTKLQEQATFRETLFNGTPVPVYVVDAGGNLINYNPAWALFFTGEGESLSRLPLNSAKHPLADIFHDILPLLTDTVTPASSPKHYRVYNGVEERVIVHQAVTYQDHTGAVAGLIGSWQDITEHETLLAALSNARERAEQANRTKSTFLATMSHEIRTPISAIIGLLELAVTTPEQQRAETEKDSIRVAYDSALSLMGLIGDILDLAKIESGKLELTPEWVRIDDLALPVVHVFDGLARQKGITLECHIDALHPDEVYLDPMRLRQILSNLVSNAIKFTDQGLVNVQIHCLPENENQAMLTLIVTDTGVGIAPEEQATIFAPYVQSEAGKHQQGTGLGLAICAQLVSMMQGTIDLHSQPERGTRITVCIPVEHRQHLSIVASEREVITSTEQPLCILAVDDHPANRLLLTRQLSRLGHQVIEAENGRQALELWLTQPIDLVITDCNMPVMDGLELTRQLRQQQRKPLIILGLTANAQPEERVRCIAAGMDDCLFKPLRLSQLDALLKRLPRQSAEWGKESRVTLQELVDLPALEGLAQQDKTLLRHLLLATREENARDMQHSRQLLDEENWQGLARSLHRLAGATQIVGAAEAENHCRSLEQYCENTAAPDKEQVAQKLHLALSALQRLNQAIDDFTAE
ncbi:ATP-binding protein [Serratia marcescens]|uniref:ATP-binding protein n=1 Tax=Serratia marcescens TaxID=615 RepID=UPI0028758C8E|nr:transporter substrate-binding domain-containing protein [Serratia marcescens]MDS0824895.1 transporter substrate-binding domain-containing protein [Serratia marcescens]